MKKSCFYTTAALAILIFAAGCSSSSSDASADSSQASADSESASVSGETAINSEIYINGNLIDLTGEGASIDLTLLSVENGVEVSAVTEDDEQIFVNGEEYTGPVSLDVTAIMRDETISIEITNDEGTADYTINLMPSTLPDYTTEGESQTDGDYYLTTYDEEVNYIFKLDNQGNLIFYKETGDNALDFRKQYNSDGEVRYTYLQYLENTFCGIEAINPGCVVVMDENYTVIDELYYQASDGEEIMIDPHGFIYIDDGHYILTAYEDIVVEDIPEDLGAQDDSAYLAVLYVQEVQDSEVLWEFCSQDYEEFLYATAMVTWDASTDECYDYMHFNSMYIDNDDNLLISCRNIDSIIKVSRQTGELIWILGGSEDEFGLTEDQLFSRQHSIIVTDDGSYMLFNNANTQVSEGKTDVSSIVKLKVDEETMTVTEYSETDTEFYSNYMGAIRELDSESGIYLYSAGGNYLEGIPEYSMIEYSETEGYLFTFRFDEGYRRLYCANKCE